MIGALAGIGAAPTHAAPVPTPATDHCPHKVGTPPPVDTSEVVAPGSTTPPPLPVPESPRGGSRLAGCGVVHDPAAGALPRDLTSSGWLIADLDSGDVIAAKDPHGRYRPASTIKVLLALVAIDELELDTTVEATDEDWMAEGDSCGMGPRGKYTNRQLLTGLIVVSGNDCATALARELGGREQTLAKMNTKARELGALDTRAASPSGLDAPGMSSSPYDLAVIFRAAMRDDLFRELIALPTYRFPGYPRRLDVPEDKDHPAYLMQTSNHMLLDGYPGMIGGKTGYTDDARKTFVGAVQRDGRTLVIVQMFGLTYEGNSYWDQAARMIDYGFHSPAGTRVGSLDTDSGDAAAARQDTGDTVAPTTNPAAAQRASTHSDTGPSSWPMRLLVGLGLTVIALILLSVGLGRFSRR
nr:D-alanyl-D-alanine carboxypeptidase family protein [Gordonia soli]